MRTRSNAPQTRTLNLQDRIRSLVVPAGDDQDTVLDDRPCFWDISYATTARGPRGPAGGPGEDLLIAWAHVAYDPIDGPFLLTVESGDWAFAFAPDGSIARARSGDRHAVATGDKEAAFTRFVAAIGLARATPPPKADPLGDPVEEA